MMRAQARSSLVDHYGLDNLMITKGVPARLPPSLNTILISQPHQDTQASTGRATTSPEPWVHWGSPYQLGLCTIKKQLVREVGSGRAVIGAVDLTVAYSNTNDRLTALLSGFHERFTQESRDSQPELAAGPIVRSADERA
jgi:hypothetical protein